MGEMQRVEKRERKREKERKIFCSICVISNILQDSSWVDSGHVMTGVLHFSSSCSTVTSKGFSFGLVIVIV